VGEMGEPEGGIEDGVGHGGSGERAVRRHKD
jgi:hypothetical protein